MKFFADCEVELFLQIESIFIKQNQRHSAQIRIKKKKERITEKNQRELNGSENKIFSFCAIPKPDGT